MRCHQATCTSEATLAWVPPGDVAPSYICEPCSRQAAGVYGALSFVPTFLPIPPAPDDDELERCTTAAGETSTTVRVFLAPLFAALREQEPGELQRERILALLLAFRHLFATLEHAEVGLRRMLPMLGIRLADVDAAVAGLDHSAATTCLPDAVRTAYGLDEPDDPAQPQPDRIAPA